MSLAEFEDFLQEFHLMDDTFTDQRRLLSYIWAQELVEDDMASDQAERMSFVEFVHVLCFIANMRSAASSGVVDVEEQSRESPTSPLLKGSPRSSPSPQPSASTDWLQHAAARIEDEVERHGSDPDSWNILAGKSVVGRDLATVSTLLPGIHLYPTRSVLKSKIEDVRCCKCVLASSAELRSPLPVGSLCAADQHTVWARISPTTYAARQHCDDTAGARTARRVGCGGR